MRKRKFEKTPDATLNTFCVIPGINCNAELIFKYLATRGNVLEKRAGRFVIKSML